MIILIGNEYFSAKISKSFRTMTTEKILCLDTQNRGLDKVLFLLLLPFARLLYSISGSVTKGGALRYAMLWKKKIYQHFIGSDVTRAIADYKRGVYSQSLMDKSSYMAEVDWIASELFVSIGIKAEVVPLPIVSKTLPSVKKPNFVVACYVGEGREEFYGINEILNAALALPSVSFIIAGSSGDRFKECSTENVQFLGWVDDFSTLLNDCAIYLRVTEHDGLPFSVIEALSYERWVLYNRVFPYCELVQSSEDIISTITTYYAEYTAGRCINDGARNFVSSLYTDDIASSNILSKFR